MLETLESFRSFGGQQIIAQHESKILGGPTRWSIFLPSASQSQPVPVLYFLSGLTCTCDNFTQKSGFQRVAEHLGLAVVAPDTSPRGDQVADDDSYDLGQGAGFYLDATQEPWAPHFRMESFIIEELIPLVESQFPTLPEHRGIFGHSMGGHGALTLAHRHQELFKSCSAFAPIVNPSKVPWGRKAFHAYLGPDEELWLEHDACHLYGESPLPYPIFVDQGNGDNFLYKELQPEEFEAACLLSGQQLTLKFREGYDHSYYFISSFIEEHLHYHARQLKAISS